MKTKFYPPFLWLVALFLATTCLLSPSVAQNATRSMPVGIGRNCNAGTSTTNASDSVKAFNFTDGTNQLTSIYACKPSLQSPSFSPYSGSLAFNPQDQKLYYIETTNGVNSYIYRWLPNTCPTSSYAYSYSYTNRYIVGLDFNPVTGDGYQLEFNGSTSPYIASIRKVNFSSGTFGPVDTLILPPGKNIYVQSGDVVFTPLGQLYFAFDNKLFQVDYSNYGPGVKLNTTFIDTLVLGNTLLGLSYAHGKFIASCQNGNNTSCFFKEIDISSGSAVITPITLPSGIAQYTGTDLASLISGIGVAKRVAGVSFLSATTFIVQYDIKVKNYGNTNLTNVQVVDSIAKVFGPAFTSASVSAVGTLPSGLTLNAAYNGITNCNLFVGGVGSTMAATPTDSATVRVSVYLTNPNQTTTYYSTSIGSAQSLFSTSISDSSNQSYTLLPDINFNSVPDDNNEDIPTPLNFSVWSTLPFKVVDFTASAQGKNVALYCSLQNSDAPTTIYVQKSIDNSHFETIASTEADISAKIEQYNWLDKELPKNKVLYYRLKFTRKDGTSYYSAVSKISTAAIIPEIIVSPNPFQNEISMEINLKVQETISYNLINLNGKVIYQGTKNSQTGSNKITLTNLAHLPKGVYLLQINVGGDIYDRKIVKMD